MYIYTKGLSVETRLQREMSKQIFQSELDTYEPIFSVVNLVPTDVRMDLRGIVKQI